MRSEGKTMMPRDEWAAANNRERALKANREAQREGVPKVMPFGKHRGKAFRSVPTNYLSWLLQECTLSVALRQAVSEEYGKRVQAQLKVASEFGRDGL
jgi:hypothetical protein